MGEEIISYQIDTEDEQVISDFLQRNGIVITEGIRQELWAMVNKIANEAYNKGRKRAK